jgi:pre-mRNA-splicing factor CWC22
MADYEEVDYEPDDDDLHRASVKGGAGDSETEDEESVGPAPNNNTSPKNTRDDSPRSRGDSDGSEGELHEAGKKSKQDTQANNALTAAAELPSSRSNGSRPLQQESNTGVYIPPARRRILEQQQAADSSKPSAALSTIQSQRTSWENLKRTINGTINRLSSSTIKPLIHDLFTYANLLRGRGILARSILRASQASPQYANVYAALAAVVNTKLPEVGELLLTRAILAFRRGYKTKDRNGVSSSLALLGHLFNQGMAQELLSLQILTVLLDGDPTEDSVDVAVGYMCIVGRRLMEVSPAGVHAVMERFRGLLHEGSVGKRGSYRIESLLKIRKGGFADYPTIEEELDLVEREDQITFEIGLDDEGLKKEEGLDVFRFDEEYDEKEKEWAVIRAEILGDDSDEDGSGSESGSGNESSDEEKEIPDQELVESRKQDEKKTVVIQDLTETDLVHLRRTIYLTIMSSATFEECTHKLAKMDIPEGREHELINMIIECCSQERTFLRYYGLISGRFCLLHERWQDSFQEAFATQYNTIHRLETNKLRNVAKLFGHLLHTDSISWSVLSVIHLNEDETTSSSRIFIKILIQEMAEAMGMGTLKTRFDTDNPDPDGELAPADKSTTALVPRGKFGDRPVPVSTREWFKGMFPKDNARNTRYAINFFTSIGLGPLTDGMREFLKNAPKLILAQAQALAAKEAERKKYDSDASSVISTSSSSTSSFDSSSSSSSFSSSSSYTSSSSSSYSSDSRGKGRKGRSRRSSRDKKRRRSYSSSSSSSGSSYSRDRKKSSKKKTDKRRNDAVPRDVANSDSKASDADKDSRADASRSVSLSRDRHSRRKRSYSSSRSKSRSRSRGRSPSPPARKSSKEKSHDETKGRGSKRERSPSYSSSSRSSSRSPPPNKHEKKRGRHDSRDRSASLSDGSRRR